MKVDILGGWAEGVRIFKGCERARDVVCRFEGTVWFFAVAYPSRLFILYQRFLGTILRQTAYHLIDMLVFRSN